MNTSYFKSSSFDFWNCHKGQSHYAMSCMFNLSTKSWNLEYVGKLCWGECYLCEFCDYVVKVARIPKKNSLINNASVKNCQKKGDINTTTFFFKKKPLNLTSETWISLHLQTIMIAKLEFKGMSRDSAKAPTSWLCMQRRATQNCAYFSNNSK